MCLIERKKYSLQTYLYHTQINMNKMFLCCKRL